MPHPLTPFSTGAPIVVPAVRTTVPAGVLAAVPATFRATLSAVVPAAFRPAFSAAVPAVFRPAFPAAVPAAFRAAFPAAVPAVFRPAFPAAVPAACRAAFPAAIPAAFRPALSAAVPAAFRPAFSAAVPAAFRPAFPAAVPAAFRPAFPAAVPAGRSAPPPVMRRAVWFRRVLLLTATDISDTVAAAVTKPVPRPTAGWRSILSTLPIALLLPLPAASGAALAPTLATADSDAVRVKDIADVEGIRENQLVGYGLVVGLNGTGDKLDNAVFTKESLVGMLERLGVNTRDQLAKLQTKNVAAVMATATLPAFARTGSRIDISVSAIGDATNLSGGTLLVTPMMAADGEVYGVAQGAISTGAISAKGAAGSVTRNVPTAGKIANGAIVEREVAFSLGSRPDLFLALRNPDLTTARRIEAAINDALGAGTAHATDPRSVSLHLDGRDVVAALDDIEELRVEPDQPAVVIIDEASGTIVMGANVRISTVAIAQGNLTIRVTENPQVSQPAPFSRGKTTTVPRSTIAVDTQSDHKLGILTSAPTLRDLVASLNALGVGPRDLISILQSIKAAGALQADLEVR